MRAAIDSGMDKNVMDSCYRRVKEIPFDSDRKLMSVVCRTNKGDLFLFAKGAPEVVLEKCNKILVGEYEREMTFNERENVMKECRKMTAMALRVIGFAYRTVEKSQLLSDKLEEKMVFIGLAGMTDPPRRNNRSCLQMQNGWNKDGDDRRRKNGKLPWIYTGMEIGSDRS